MGKTKSLAQIRKQIGIQKAKIAKQKARDRLEDERVAAERELRILSRSSSTKRNIILARRTFKGFKRIAKAGAKIGAKQIKLIKDQQIRDDAVSRNIQRKRAKVMRGIKKTRGTVKKTRSALPGQIIADLDF